MRIALLGYGKMGKVIERIALERGHKIVLKVDGSTKNYNIALADVAIDFSVPSAAVSNITQCLTSGVPIISGTTGWLDQYDAMVSLCEEHDGAFIYASNFSLGVNLFFALNETLAKMIAPFQQYTSSIEEIHHTEKLDAPSGTAISLAQDIIKNTSATNWELDGKESSSTLPIKAVRTPKVPGTHTVTYASSIDDISIKHTAHNREGFALGAVIAAEWLKGKTGIFTMKDVLNFG